MSAVNMFGGRQFLDLVQQQQPLVQDIMSRFSWRQALTGLSALSSLTSAQSSTSSAPTETSTWRPLFSIPAAADVGQPILPNIKDPEAVDPQSVCPGYTATDVVTTPHGYTALLQLAGEPCNVYGTDVNQLNLTVQYESADRLNIEIVPTYISNENYTHYILPTELVHKAGLDDDAAVARRFNDLAFEWGNSPSFWFSVTRKSVGDVLFSTKGTSLVFENQFLEFKTSMPTDYNLYGLGETVRPLRLGTNYTKTMWNADVPDTVDANIYGTYPIYYDTRYYKKSGSSWRDSTYTYVPWSEASSDASYIGRTHGAYLRNAHAHEILMREDAVTWRTLGGSIDLTFFSGPTVKDVAKSFQSSSIGYPAMQQYFAFGYHQCKWGYVNYSQIEDVANSFKEVNLPLETLWSDIDYMQQFRDFTTDSVSYPQAEFAAFIDRLHAAGQHYVPITDSAIYIPNPTNASDAYDVFERGNASNAFMHNPDGSLYIGAVWPGYTVFPDWLSAGAAEWWTSEVKNFHANGLPFDGLWIDMSEVSSFCVGSCGSGNLTLNPAPGGISTDAITQFPEGFNTTNATEYASAQSIASAASATAVPTSTTETTSYFRSTPTPGVRDVNYPPYAINNILGDLAVHAMSPNATHSDALSTQDYDIHNLWGFQILNATYNALTATQPSKRPFIIGRSTFAGAGHVAGHWGGDNSALWYFMVFSIPQALSMSLFGVPMFGVDTCGFQGNTDAELCARWMQLSAFFPLYRNHNTIHAIPQEPYRWSSVLSATRTAMDIRHALLPYMYTLFHAAHTRGETVMRHLAWEFPDDPLLANADRQFFLGSSILVSPVLIQGASEVDVVFPGAAQGEIYYDWYNQSSISSDAAKSGRNVTLSAPLGTIPVHVRGGAVIGLQPAQDALVTRDMRTKPWDVLVALDKYGAAMGGVYLDDGESIAPNATTGVHFKVKKGVLEVMVRGSYYDGNEIGGVVVMGVESVQDVKLGSKELELVGWMFDPSAQRLKVQMKGVAWDGDWTLKWT